MLCHQILVQPYLLAFKGVVPEYTQVPSKDSPFDESFYANTHISSNKYPAASDVISGVSQSEKTSSLYVRHKTGKVCACFVFASTSKVTAMYVFIFSCQAMFTGPGMPVSFYQELFFRFGSSWAGQLVVDLSPERSKIGEAAIS